MMKTIENNHVAVKPLDDALAIVMPYMKASPYNSSNPNVLHSSIIYSTSPLLGFKPDTKRKYKAKIIGAQLWYDPYMGIKDLVIALDSPDLVNRQQEIVNKYRGVSIYQEYMPHLTLVYDITGEFNYFVNEVLDAFASRYKGKVITFGDEYIESSSGMLNQGSDVVPDTGLEMLVRPIKVLKPVE